MSQTATTLTAFEEAVSAAADAAAIIFADAAAGDTYDTAELRRLIAHIAARPDDRHRITGDVIESAMRRVSAKHGTCWRAPGAIVWTACEPVTLAVQRDASACGRYHVLTLTEADTGRLYARLRIERHGSGLTYGEATLAYALFKMDGQTVRLSADRVAILRELIAGVLSGRADGAVEAAGSLA